MVLATFEQLCAKTSDQKTLCWLSSVKCQQTRVIFKYKRKYLFSEDIGENPTDHGDDREEEEEDKVGEEEALDLLHRRKPAEAREEDHEDGGDEDGVGGVHVQPVPQQFLQEGFVVHRPEAEGQKNYAAHLQMQIHTQIRIETNMQQIEI